MLIRDVAASLIRRWYLTLAGLLITTGLVLLALALVHPTWQSKASIVLLPPKSSIEPGGNPYLQLDGLSPTVDLLVASLSEQKMQDAIKQVSPTAEYTVKPDATSSGPVLTISSDDRTSIDSIAARNELVRQAPIKLAELQDTLAIPSRARIGSMVLTQDEKPELVGKDQVRALVAAVGAGLVGTALFVAFVDGWLIRRRKDSRQVEGASGDVVEESGAARRLLSAGGEGASGDVVEESGAARLLSAGGEGASGDVVDESDAWPLLLTVAGGKGASGDAPRGILRCATPANAGRRCRL